MKSILIVAGETEARAALARRLEQDDYLVMAASDVSEARECLKGLLPGAMVIDLPVSRARQLIQHMVKDPVLRLIPRLLVVEPLKLSGRPLSAAAAFVRPLQPDHLARSLTALYPRGRWNVPAAAAVQASLKAERIQEAIDQVVSVGASEAVPPETITLPAPPAAPIDGPSDRAISVAQSFAIESMAERVGNDASAARLAADRLPTTVSPANPDAPAAAASPEWAADRVALGA